MKDMTVKELIVKCGVGWNDFKAELLRRFEDMKCCGNCEYHHNLEIECPKIEDRSYHQFDYPMPCRYCPHWQTDGLTREERESK